MPVSIRTATEGDADALLPLLEELGYPATAEVLVARLRSLEMAGETHLVAEVDGKAVGLIGLHVTPVIHRPTPVGRITLLVVREAIRGRGVGQALVAEAERRLAAQGCALVEVTSNRKRTDAHAFYRRLGYEETSVRFGKVMAPRGD